MPKLSDSMEEATVLAWLKRPGDAVERGEPLVEVETDKATVVYEAETGRHPRRDPRRRRRDRGPRRADRAHAPEARRRGAGLEHTVRGDASGQPGEIEFREALRQALDEELERDERVSS